MPINSITLKNYRSYESASFEFGPGVTIIIGPNASGKTNLLEAVYTLCVGNSFRVSDKDLIRDGSAWARVETLITDNERVLKIIESTPRTKKSFTINGIEKSRLMYEQIIPAVLFEPDDIRIIGGSPDRRREYLDTLIANISPTYKRSLASFRRALKQRNNLLKQQGSRQNVFPWDVVMSRHAGQIVAEREAVIAQINNRITAVYQTLSDKDETINIHYEHSLPTINYASHYLNRLEQMFSTDLAKGYTSTGPHRDDMTIKINGNVASTHASRGECRTITLALKVIEMLLIEETRNEKPILLLDDVFSELDGTRRRKLTEYLSGHQSIITTTDADVVDKKFAKIANFISL